VIALTRQNIVTSLVFKVGATSLVQHIAGHGVKELSFGMKTFSLVSA
jgi:hypothetical protein